MFKQKKYFQQGVIMIYLVVIIAIFFIIITPIVTNFVVKIHVMLSSANKEQAFQIAEAGINYYQWHLAKYPTDYTDYQGVGQLPALPSPGTVMGPYVHDYIDQDTQQTIGQFSLKITVPLSGGSAVVVQSIGWTNDSPNLKKTITAIYGNPSLASYSLLTHGWIYAWNTEVYNGPIHGDTGIRFEGTTSSSITSSVQSTYLDDCNQEYPQSYCPTTSMRPAIWATGSNKSQSSPYWSNPTTITDFGSIDIAFGVINTKSQLNGNINLNASNSQGYSLVFNNNGTVTVYKVLKTTNTGSLFPVTKSLSGGTDTGLGSIIGGTDYGEGICNKNTCNGCGNSGRCFQYIKAIPSTGLAIYSTENLWVEGTIKGRVIIATATGNNGAATNPNENGSASNLMPNIYISGNIRYSNGENGSSGIEADTLGLMAQGNIIVTKNAPDPLYVDGALLAQNGFVAFPICYSGGAAKQNLYFFGSLILNGSWWFNFTNYCGGSFTDGYLYPHFTWDTNLLYYPPPYFPASSVNANLRMIKWVTN
jgi:hypothetical protein